MKAQKPVDQFHDYVIGDIFPSTGLPNITSKRMFGGYGYYLDGAIFAIITSGSDLYFKVDEALKETFRKHGSEPFIYHGHKNRKPTEMSYWLLPEEIMENPEALTDWIIASAAVSKKQKQ